MVITQCNQKSDHLAVIWTFCFVKENYFALQSSRNVTYENLVSIAAVVCFIEKINQNICVRATSMNWSHKLLIKFNFVCREAKYERTVHPRSTLLLATCKGFKAT